MKRNAWRRKRNTIINNDGSLLSLLYDLDLLPEQVKRGSRDEWKLDSTVLHWHGQFGRRRAMAARPEVRK